MLLLRADIPSCWHEGMPDASKSVARSGPFAFALRSERGSSSSMRKNSIGMQLLVYIRNGYIIIRVQCIRVSESSGSNRVRRVVSDNYTRIIVYIIICVLYIR